MTERKPRSSDLLESMGRMVVPIADESADEREQVIEAVNRRLDSARFEQRKRVQKRWSLVAAAAVLCLSSGFAFAHYGLGAHAPSETQASNASLLEPGAAVHTAPKETRVGLLEDGAEVQIAESTELSVAALSPGSDEIVLDRGRVELSVPKLRAGHTLSVTTPDTIVTVRGTHFSVAVAQEDSRVITSVQVTHGSVWVRQGESRWVLEAGSRWSSREQPTPATSAATPSTAVPATSLGSPTSSQIFAPIALSSAQPSAAPSSRKPSAASAGNASSVSKVEPGAAPPEAASTLAQENDLYAAASSAARSHDDTLAVSELSSLLARYPSSPLAQNARVDRFRALTRLGRKQEAVAQARRYLADYPNGFARDEAKALVLSSLANP